MFAALASAARQTHSGKVADTTGVRLVVGDTSVTFVMVTVRPHAVGGRRVAGSSKVTHSPETWPETNGVTTSRQRDRRLQVTTLEAQHVPRLQHAGAVVQVVVLESIELNRESAVCGSNRIGIIPLLK